MLFSYRKKEEKNIIHSLLLCVCMLSCLIPVWFFVTLWTIACQAPLSIGFSRQEYREWVAIPFSRGSSQQKDWTHVSYISCITGEFFTTSATYGPSFLALSSIFTAGFSLWSPLCVSFYHVPLKMPSRLVLDSFLTTHHPGHLLGIHDLTHSWMSVTLKVHNQPELFLELQVLRPQTPQLFSLFVFIANQTHLVFKRTYAIKEDYKDTIKKLHKGNMKRQNPCEGKSEGN